MADALHIFLNGGLQMLQAAQFDLVGRVVGQIGRRGSRARAEDEAERRVVAHIGDELHHLLEIFFGFTWKAHDEVRAHRHVRAYRAQFAQGALVLHGGVAPFHGHQDAIAAVLYRQMQMVHQLRHFGVSVDQALGKFIGVAGGVADALDARDVRHILQQQGKVGDVSGATHGATVGVHVLAQQRDLFDPLPRQSGHLDQHIVQGSADFFAAGVGHHAIAAVFGATLHDADKGAGTFHAGRWQVVKLLNLWKADVHLRAAFVVALVQQVRQPVQGLRAKHHVNIGRTLNDGGAFLAGHAPPNGNFDALGLEVLHPAQIGEHFFLGFLSHRAGVEQDEVGLFHILGFFVALCGAKNIGHLVRVVLVHLASKRFDEDFAAHDKAFLGA